MRAFMWMSIAIAGCSGGGGGGGKQPVAEPPTAAGVGPAGERVIATLDPEISVLAMATDDTSLYVAASTDGKTRIERLPKTGGALAPVVSDVGVLAGLVVADHQLVWTEIATGRGRLVGAPLATGAPHEIASLGKAIPVGLASDATDFYILIDGTWDEHDDVVGDASLLAIHHAGGAARIVADHLEHFPSDLVLTATEATFITGGRTVWRVPKAGGAATKSAAPPPAQGFQERDATDGTTTFRAVRDRATAAYTITAR